MLPGFGDARSPDVGVMPGPPREVRSARTEKSTPHSTVRRCRFIAGHKTWGSGTSPGVRGKGLRTARLTDAHSGHHVPPTTRSTGSITFFGGVPAASKLAAHIGDTPPHDASHTLQTVSRPRNPDVDFLTAAASPPDSALDGCCWRASWLTADLEVEIR